MTATKILSCSIKRKIKGRVLIDDDQVVDLFQIFSSIYQTSIELAPADEKEVIRRLGAPKIKIFLLDGSEYEGSSPDLIKQIKTTPKRLIQIISISSRYGEFSGSLQIGSRYSNLDPIDINMVGPEDKAQHALKQIEDIITARTDITLPFYKFIPFPLAIIISLLFVFPLLYYFAGSASILKYGFFPIIFSGVVGSFILSFIIAIFVEHAREKWFRPVSFMWGANLERHLTAKKIAQAFGVGLPLWLLSNFAAGIYFGSK